MAQRAAEAAQRVRCDAEAEAEQKRQQADLKVADANEYHARAKDTLTEAEQKLAAAAKEAAAMREDATAIKDSAHVDGFQQGLQQGREGFNRSVADLLTRDGGEKRITMEHIGVLAGGDQDRISQAREIVMSKLHRQAESTLAIGTPVRPTRQKVEATAQGAAAAPVTDPGQARRIIAASSIPGRSTGRSVSKGKGMGPQFGR